ncbi:MAG TPA: hypothetical protein VGM84_10325 [Steroidobacteraceae bacterium]|jgi:hypothetical protein
MNLYAYAGNDLINGTDPSGRCIEFVLGETTVDGIRFDDPQPAGTEDDCAPPLPNIGDPNSGPSIAPFTPTDIPGYDANSIPMGDVNLTPPTNPWTQCKSESKLGKVAEALDQVGTRASRVALVSGVAALATSETIIGGISFGGIAAASGLLSVGANVTAGVLKFADASYKGALTSAASVGLGLLIPKGLQNLAPAARGFGGEGRKQFGEVLAEAEGEAGSSATEAMICP